MLASYGGYHRDRRNRLTHYVGVPTIIFALLIPASLARVPMLPAALSGDRLLLAALILWYLSLDVPLGLALAVLLGLLAFAAEATAELGAGTALTVAGVVFVAGWALQLLGHRFEGNRPALLDNLLQALVAPIYLVTELAFAFGWRRALQSAVQARKDG